MPLWFDLDDRQVLARLAAVAGRARLLTAGAFRLRRGGAFGFADLAFAPENPVREFRHFGFECLDLLILFQQAFQSPLMHAIEISGLLPVMDRRLGESDFFLLPSLMLF